MLSDDPDVLALWRESTKRQDFDRGNQYTGGKSDNITLAKERGTSKSYTLSRLKREAPELYERVCNRELSANAAAIEAGFRRVQTPIEQAKRWYNKLSEAERKQFMEWVSIVST